MTAQSLPKVTVMIPTYRQAEVVGRAIDSALAQDYPQLEVLVVDDCSPDATAVAVAERKDSRLRYHRNPSNLGRVANYRQALYGLAAGEWVVNLDGDDYFTDPGFISAAIEATRTDDGIVLVAARAEVRTPRRSFRSQIPPERLLDGRLVALRAARHEYHLMHLSSLYRRSAALPLDFYRADVISSDLESLYRLACHGKVAFLDRTVGVWNVAASSASQTDRWQPLARNMQIWDAIGTELVSTGIAQAEAQRAMDAAAFAIGYVNAAGLIDSGQIVGALRFVASMQNTSPRVKAGLLLHYRLLGRFLLGMLGLRRNRLSQ